MARYGDGETERAKATVAVDQRCRRWWFDCTILRLTIRILESRFQDVADGSDTHPANDRFAPPTLPHHISSTLTHLATC